jgi:hypothetical protein
MPFRGTACCESEHKSALGVIIEIEPDEQSTLSVRQRTVRERIAKQH